MKLFKDTNNEIFAYASDGSQDHLIGNKVAVTQEEANQLIASKQQAEFNSLTYVEKRIMSYPPISNYIDGVVKGDQEQIDKYIADCLAVKAQYPKD
jgi:hypothetical protein